MKPIETLNADTPLAELEQAKLDRDLEVQKLRAEMRSIHRLCEPKWHAAQEAQKGPAYLAQTVGVDLKKKGN